MSRRLPLPSLLGVGLLVLAAGAAGQAQYLVQPLTRAINQGFDMYVTQVTAGTPPQPLLASFSTLSGTTFLVSANCTDPACTLHPPYDPTASDTYQPDAEQSEGFEILYGVNVSGVYARDTLGVAGAALANVSVGVVTSMLGPDWMQYDPAGSCVGLGLDGPLLDAMLDQAAVESRVVGAYFGAEQGELTFGGLNSQRYVGEISYVNVFPGADFWTVYMERLALDGAGGPLDLCGGTRHGCNITLQTTAPYLSTSPAQATEIAAAVQAEPLPDTNGTAFSVDCKHLQQLPVLHVTLAGHQLQLAGPEYTVALQPPAEDGGQQLCVLGFLGNAELDDNSWLVGTLLLQKLYTVLDKEQRRVGFALSK